MEKSKFIKIINNDSLLELKNIKDNSIDLIFSDPPYWMRTTGILKRVEGTTFSGCDDEWDNQFNDLNEYISFTKNWLKECYRILSPSGSIWVIGSMQCIYTIGNVMQELGYWILNDVIWHKKNPTPNFKGTRLNNSHETLIWAVKSNKSKYTFNYKTAKELNIDNVSLDDFEKGVRKQMGSVWRIPICQGSERLKDETGHKLHSTQKPEELLYRIINISSKIGDVVLDPFGGTMTTGAIAKQCGRSFIGIEKNKKYCEYGIKRLENIVENIGNIESSIYDEKPLKVSLKEMIDNKYFFKNEKFYLKNKTDFVFLQPDGKIKYQNGKIDNIHSAAAILSNKKVDRVNGFDYWFVERNEKLVSINVIREEYRKKIKILKNE